MAKRVAFDEDGVVDIVDAGEGMVDGNEGRVNSGLDVCRGVGYLGGVKLGDGKEFNDKAEFFGVGDVGGADVADAFAVDSFAIYAAAKGEGSEDGDFVGSV